MEDSPQPSAKASDEAGAMLGVSGRSVRDAKFVEQNDPEMFEKVKAGQVAPSAAAKKIRDAAKPAPAPHELETLMEESVQRKVAKDIGSNGREYMEKYYHYLSIELGKK